jgi:type II secretory pathway pseudopilin PulG
MLVVLASVIAILALAGAAAVGSWLARRAVDAELAALRARVRDLSARLASAERTAGSGRVGGAAPVIRRQSPGEEAQEPQPVPGSRTIH